MTATLLKHVAVKTKLVAGKQENCQISYKVYSKALHKTTTAVQTQRQSIVIIANTCHNSLLDMRLGSTICHKQMNEYKKIAAAAALTACIQRVTVPCLAWSASRPCRRTNSHCAEQRNTFPLQQTAFH